MKAKATNKRTGKNQKLDRLVEAEARLAWEAYCASGKKPADIPERPDLVYASEWKGWADWLGWVHATYRGGP